MKKIIASLGVVALLLGSVFIFKATEEGATSDAEFQILEVVANEKFQKMSYFVSGFEPIDLSKLEENIDLAYQELTYIPTLSLKGEKDTAYAPYQKIEGDGGSEMEKISQLGYYEQTPVGEGKYSPVILSKSAEFDIYKLKDSVYTKVENITDSADLSNLFYLIDGVYYSYKDIQNTPDDSSYVLYFEESEGGDWDFVPAFDGRHYILSGNLWQYQNEIQTESYSTWLGVSDKPYMNESTTMVRGSRLAVEESESVDSSITNKDLLADIVGTRSISVKVVLYDDLKPAMLNGIDLVYFNTNTADSQLSDIYTKYNPDETAWSDIDVSEAFVKSIIDRLYENSINIIYDETARGMVSKDTLSNFDKMYCLTTQTYASVIKNGKLSNGKTLYYTLGSMTELSKLYENVPVLTKTAEEYSKFNINNINLEESSLVGHSVLGVGDSFDFLKDFEKEVVDYNELTKDAFEYYNKGSSDKLTVAEEFAFLLNQKKQSNLSGTVRVMELQPCKSFLPDGWWRWRMFGIDPYFEGVVEQTKCTSREFISRNEDLLDKYDIVYIGSNTDGDYFKYDADLASITYKTHYSVGVNTAGETYTFDLSQFVDTEALYTISGVKNCDKVSDTKFKVTVEDNMTSRVRFKIGNTEYTIYIEFYVASAPIKSLDVNDKSKYKNRYYEVINGIPYAVESSSFYCVDVVVQDKKVIIDIKDWDKIKVDKYTSSGVVCVIPFNEINGIKYTDKEDVVYCKQYSELTFEGYEEAKVIIHKDNWKDAYLATKTLKTENVDISMWCGNSSYEGIYASSYDFETYTVGLDTSKYKGFRLDIAETGVDDLSAVIDGLRLQFNCTSTLEGEYKLPYSLVGILQDDTEESVLSGVVNLFVFDNYELVVKGGGFPIRYDDSDLNGIPYLKIGDLYNAYYLSRDTYGGITSLDRNGKTRGSGNDISNKKYKQIKEFMESGRLVLMSGAFYGVGGEPEKVKFDLSSNVYKIAKEATIDRGSLNYDFAYLTDTFDVEFSKIPQVYKDASTKKIIDLTGFEGVDGWSASASGSYYLNGDDINYRTLVYKFRINTPSSSSQKYSVGLYADMISDGIFSDNERLGSLQITDSSGRSVNADNLKANEDYTLMRVVDDDLVGLIHWQLQFERNDSELIRRSYDCYTALLPQDESKKKTLNILQLLPESLMYGDVTLNMETNETFRQLLGVVKEFNVSIKAVKESDIIVDGRLVDSIQVNDDLALGFHDFDMLVIGFGDAGTYVTKEPLLNAMIQYIKSGKSVLFTHDTNAHVNIYGIASQTNLAFFETKYFRNLIGQDRYGVGLYDSLNYNKLMNNDFSDYYAFSDPSRLNDIAANNGKDTTTNIHGDLTSPTTYAEGLNEYLLKPEDTWVGNKTTKQAEKVNSGQISYYPYYISRNVDVAATHPQYYQLDMNAEDVNVWYTLKNSWTFKYDGRNGRDLYYIYNKGNITYTGVGHRTVSGEEELKLFVNTLIMSYRTSGTTPELEVLNENAQNTKDKSYIYLDYDVDEPDAVKDANASGDMVTVTFSTNDISVAYNKKDYISFELVGVGASSGFQPVDEYGNPLVQTEFGWEIPINGVFSVNCDISRLKDELGIYSASSEYQIELVCRLYSSYGFEQDSVQSERSVLLIKRGLFDIH